MLAISPPGGATIRSAVSARPVISARRSMAVLSMMPSRSMRRGRTGRPDHHVIDPDGQPVAADHADGDYRHHHRGQKQKGENFHALAARPSDVVAPDGHGSLPDFEESGGIRAAAL